MIVCAAEKLAEWTLVRMYITDCFQSVRGFIYFQGKYML